MSHSIDRRKLSEFSTSLILFLVTIANNVSRLKNNEQHVHKRQYTYISI